MRLYNDDCLNVLKTFEDESIDCVLCDLPYGKFGKHKEKIKEDSLESLSWDECLDIDALAKELYRVVKKDAAVILFCQAPFSFHLYQEMTKNKFKLKHQYYWKKKSCPNFVGLRFGPGKIIEEVYIFSKANKVRYFTPEVKILKEEWTQMHPFNSITKQFITFDEAFESLESVKIKNFHNNHPLEAVAPPRLDKRSAGPDGTPLNSIIRITKIRGSAGDYLNQILIDPKYKDKFKIDWENKKIYRKIISKTGYPNNLLDYKNIDR